MGIAAGLCGIGQGRVGAAACEAIARNPGAAGAIRTAMILGLVFIETLVLFTLVMSGHQGYVLGQPDEAFRRPGTRDESARSGPFLF